MNERGSVYTSRKKKYYSQSQSITGLKSKWNNKFGTNPLKYFHDFKKIEVLKGQSARTEEQVLMLYSMLIPW